MTRIARVISHFEISHHLPDHPVHRIDHAGVIGIGLPRLTRVDHAGILWKRIAHFFAIQLQAFAVAGAERAMHIEGTEVQEERLIFVLLDEAKCHIERLIKRASVRIQLIRVSRIIGRKV